VTAKYGRLKRNLLSEMTSCGINRFTVAAQLALHIFGPPRGKSVRKVPHQAGQLHHVDRTHERSSTAHDYFWIRVPKIGPLRRNRPYGCVVNLQQQALAISIVSFADAGDPSPEQRMKRMRDLHKLQRCIRKVCILS
jgi:hypothetical protein